MANRNRASKRMTRRMAPRAGRVSPPVDVRSPSDIPKALARMKKGPITIVFVYADWCGHCQTFKPKFNEAVNTSSRDTEVVSLNETMLDNFNRGLKRTIPTATPLAPEGYPEVLIVNKKGENMGQVPSSASKEDIVNVVSNGANMVGTPASLSTSPRPSALSNSSNTSTVPIANAPIVSAKARNTLNANTDSLEAVTSSNITPMSGPVLPSLPEEDKLESSAMNAENSASTRQMGGSLFGSLGSAAYTLAPAGVLLAGLHALQRRTKQRKTRRHTRRRR